MNGTGQTYEPGPELDALIAERVMGLKVYYCVDYDEVRNWRKALGMGVMNEFDIKVHYVFLDGGYRIVPSYSTDISAAWAVVDKIESMETFAGFEIRSGDKENYNSEQGVSAYLCVGNGVHWKHSMWSAAHAICLAALKALES